METDKEIHALMRLIDDPDEDVYSTVSEKIVSLGRKIIPNLEHLWENTGSSFTQERIEFLIHRVHMRELEEEFIHWRDNNGTLLDGALLVARYHYPDLETRTVHQEIGKLSKNIWLELNSYLTPIERVNVFNGIFYNYYKMSGLELTYQNTDAFLINKALESKKGNAFANGILYLILCEQHDLPVHAVRIPRQFILAWFNTLITPENEHSVGSADIAFFIEPATGQLYSMPDVENYLRKIQTAEKQFHLGPANNREIIHSLLLELSKCYDDDKNRYKHDELISFAQLLELDLPF